MGGSKRRQWELERRADAGARADHSTEDYGRHALVRLMPPTRPPVQALGAWRGRGRDDARFEREAHRASDTLSAGKSLDPATLSPTAGAAAGLAGVHPTITSTIDGARSSGGRLSSGLQRSLSADFGADLSGVRIHTDDRAHRLNERLNARAFTSGRDVFFRRGSFDPHSRGGRDVLRHELTHVVQQCGQTTSGGLGRATQPTIQRFIMQVGRDDGYTTPMANKLKSAHTAEGFLQFKATWDPGAISGTYGEYDPKKVKYHKVGGFSRSTSRKLKGVPDTEPLRIVAHGNIYGQVGGYTAPRMFALLSRLGLPATHTGGIDIHACLPGSPYDERGTGTRKQAHIVQLQDLLAADGRTEVVRGYVHTITPTTTSQDIEVSSQAYGLFTEVYKPLFANFRSTKPFPLSDDQIQTVRRVMGADGTTWLSDHVAGNAVKKIYPAYIALRDWMRENGHFFDQARLRRAESVRY